MRKHRRQTVVWGMVLATALTTTLWAWPPPGAVSAPETAGAGVVKQLQGYWRSVGYGLLFEFEGDT